MCGLKKKETEQDIPVLESETPSAVVQPYYLTPSLPQPQPLASKVLSMTPSTPNIGASFPTPPQSVMLRPPGIPNQPEPWELPLPTSDASDSDDSDLGEYEDTRPISYSDTEGERAAKLR